MAMENLQTTLERLGNGTESLKDIEELRRAILDGKLVMASGERSVAVGSDAKGAVIITGDGNVFVQLPREVLERLFPYSYQPPELPPPTEIPEPGRLPPGSRVPLLRNVVFTGREDDLMALASKLLQPREGDVTKPIGIVQAVASTGMGGIGKTQLALEFCYRYGRFFMGVHWIQATESIETEIASCGAAMGLQPWPVELGEQVRITLAAWQQSGRRLLVLDNLGEPEILQSWLPRLGNVAVLLTSRRGQWPIDLGLHVHSLNTLKRAESIELLRALAPRLKAESDDALDRIAACLGDLPLALDLAGRYLSERPFLTISNYLREIEQIGDSLTHSSFQGSIDYSPTQHDTNLLATFELGWTSLLDDDQKTSFLICGYCAPSVPIPWELLMADTSEKGEGGECSDYKHNGRALHVLEKRGLLRVGEEGAIIHPLLCQFAREKDAKSEKSVLQPFAQSLIQLADSALQTGLPGRFRPLQAHVSVAAAVAEAQGLEETGGLWKSLGDYLMSVSDYAGAKATYERALRSNERIHGESHPEVALGLGRLGEALLRLGEYQAAKGVLERAVQTDEIAFGAYHENLEAHLRILIDTLRYLSGEGEDLIGLKSLKAALIRLRECMKAGLKEKYPEAYEWLIERGIDLDNLQQYSKNIKATLWETHRLRVTGEIPFGFDPKETAENDECAPQVADDLTEYGEGFMTSPDVKSTDLQTARMLFERALKIDETIFGPEHPRVARDLTNIGKVTMQQGNDGGARLAFERAISIYETVYGVDHPNLAGELMQLGMWLLNEGHCRDGKPVLGRALAIFERRFSDDNLFMSEIRDALQRLGQEEAR